MFWHNKSLPRLPAQDWDENELFELVCSAWPYRNLTRDEFDSVVKMLAEGFSTKRGRRAALIHHDAVNHRFAGVVVHD